MVVVHKPLLGNFTTQIHTLVLKCWKSFFVFSFELIHQWLCFYGLRFVRNYKTIRRNMFLFGQQTFFSEGCLTSGRFLGIWNCKLASMLSRSAPSWILLAYPPLSVSKIVPRKASRVPFDVSRKIDKIFPIPKKRNREKGEEKETSKWGHD